MRKQTEVLEDHRQLFSANLQQFFIRHLGYVCSIDNHFTGGGTNQAVDAAKQSGLSTTGKPHNDEYFAFINGKIRIFHRNRTPGRFQYFTFSFTFFQHLQSFLLLIAKNQIKIFNFYFTHTIKWFRLLK